MQDTSLTASLAALVLMGATGCVATIPDDRFACSSTSECPSGFRCEAGFCRIGTGELDGGELDGGALDGGMRDGGGDPGTDACVPGTSTICREDQCGTFVDACGETVTCDDCPSGLTCGGGGVPNVCGTGPCEPQTCTDVGVSCGPAADGCGNVLDCGGCGLGERCAGGTCVACGDPLAPRTCADSGDCAATEEVCVEGYCLAHCGNETALRDAVASLRGGARAIAHFCIDTYTAVAVPSERDGCAGWDIVDVVATSPTATDVRWYVNRWQLSARNPFPSQEDVANVTVSLSSASAQVFTTRRLDVSPDGSHALFGYTRDEGTSAVGGELFRVRFSDRSVSRTNMVGVSDVAWLDDQRALVIARNGVQPQLYWVEWSGSGMPEVRPLVSEFGQRSTGFDVLRRQGVVILGGLPGADPSGAWPGGGGNWITFAVPMSSLVDSTGQPTRTSPLPAYSSPETAVVRHPNLPPSVVVGDWLVGQSASFGGVEMRRLGGDSFESLTIAAPMGLYISGPFFTPVGDRHVILSYAPRSLLVELPE